MFQSPLGEVVKETQRLLKHNSNQIMVSIPSRGSGKGDFLSWHNCNWQHCVSIPSRGSGKGDPKLAVLALFPEKVSIPSRGSGKGDVLTIGKIKIRYGSFQSPLGEVVKETLRPGSLTQKGFQASNRRTIFYLSIRP